MDLYLIEIERLSKKYWDLDAEKNRAYSEERDRKKDLEETEALLEQTKAEIDRIKQAKELKGVGLVKKIFSQLKIVFKSMGTNLKINIKLNFKNIMYLLCIAALAAMSMVTGPWYLLPILLVTSISFFILIGVGIITYDSIKIKKEYKGMNLDDLLTEKEGLIAKTLGKRAELKLQINKLEKRIEELEKEQGTAGYQKRTLEEEREEVISQVVEDILNQEFEARRTRKNPKKKQNIN